MITDEQIEDLASFWERRAVFSDAHGEGFGGTHRQTAACLRELQQRRANEQRFLKDLSDIPACED